ncbi:MAG: tetratricopeptide repeat protein, partial [Oceanococcaceae bacterium]
MNALSQLSTVAPTLARRFPPMQVLLGLLLAHGLVACSLMPQRGEPLPEDAPPVVRPAPSPRTDATTAILAAELAARRGSMDQAALYTLEAARITGDVALAERATKLAFAAEDESLAEEAAALWLELAPEDEAARNLRLRARISRGEATLEDLRQWLEQSSDGDLAETQLAGLLGAASPDADQALGLLTALEEERASAGLAYGLGVLALRYGEPDMALDALQRARERGWNARECDELSLRVQLAQGDLQAAAESLRALRGAPSGGRTEALALGQLLLDAEAWDLARTHFAWARTRWPEDPAAALALGLLEAQDGNDAAARTHFQDLWTQKTRPDEAAWQMARLEGRAGNWAEAERWFARVERGSRYFDAQLGLAHALSEQARLLEAQAVLAELRATQPMQAPRAWMAEAELLERRGMQAEALRLIDQAIAEEPTKDLYYKRALMHEQAGDIQAAEADLQWIIKRA